MSNNLGDRRNYIGGSDIAAILGISPFKTRSALLRQKLEGTPDFYNGAMEFGNDWEDTLVEGDRLMLGYDDTNCQLIQDDEEVGFPIICHFDRVCQMKNKDGEYFLVEVKTSGKLFGGILPAYYVAQVQTYIYFLRKKLNLDIKRARIICGERVKTDSGLTLGGTEAFWLEYDPEFWPKAKPAIENFVSDVLAARANGVLPVEEFALAPISDNAISQFVDAFRMREAAEGFIEKFNDELKSSMKNLGLTACQFGEFKATLSADTTRKGIDTTRLKKEKPEIAAEYEKETPVSGALRITKLSAKA